MITTYASVSGAPWVPAFKRDLEAVLNDVKLQPKELFIELGCGDGRLVVAAAKRGAQAIGYEINPVLFSISWIRVLPYRKHAQVHCRNLWRVKLNEADVVLAFLVPRTVPKLYQKAKKEMKPGSRLVSYIFAIPGRKATVKGHNWHVYTI